MRPNYYHQDFQQQQREQRQHPYYNNRRFQPLNDGFSITDGSQGTVVAVDGQSRADYDKMIKSNFKYTQDNYQEAYKDAARTGRPVVAIFGGFESNNSRQLIENSLPSAKNGAAKDAVYIYIDRAKVKDTKLAEFADGQLAGGHNAAVSLVFSVKPGADGSLQPEAANFRWQGADQSMISSFNQAITDAKGRQESYIGKFNPNALLEKTEQTESSDGKTEKKTRTFGETRALISEEMKAAGAAKDWHDAERHYHEAMDAADKFTPTQIKAEEERIAKALGSTPQDSPQFQQLAKDQANLTFVKNAKAAARAALGISCLEWGENESDPERKEKFRQIGSRWIDSAALRDPSLYQNPELIKRIEATGIPSDEIKRLLPKLGSDAAHPDLFQYGGDGKKQDLFQYGGDGKKPPAKKQSDTPPSTVPTSGVTRPEETKRPDAKETDEARRLEEAKRTEEAKRLEETRQKEARAKEKSDAEEAKKRELERRQKVVKEDEDKAVKSTEEYYKALADAAAKGLPVIVKVGSKTCGPCHAMAPALKEQEDALKDKAVVVRVLYENTEDLALALGAGAGVPITKFARPAPNSSANAGLDEIIPERHRGFTDPATKENFSQADVPDTVKYFVDRGMAEWQRRRATKR